MLGIAESFRRRGSSRTSILAGVVMRRDLVIDGMIFSRTTIEGDDSTCAISGMYKSLGRTDVNCIMLDGLVISMYNIIDGHQVYMETGVPTIAITFEESVGLEGAIEHHFPHNWQQKVVQYKKLGERERVILKTNKSLYIRYWGISQKNAVKVLNAFTLQGSVPEPIKVAKIAARASHYL